MMHVMRNTSMLTYKEHCVQVDEEADNHLQQLHACNCIGNLTGDVDITSLSKTIVAYIIQINI